MNPKKTPESKKMILWITKPKEVLESGLVCDRIELSQFINY